MLGEAQAFAVGLQEDPRIGDHILAGLEKVFLPDRRLIDGGSFFDFSEKTLYCHRAFEYDLYML
jgi:hypothetical protein